MCTAIEGADPADIGFKNPDELDRLRIEYFADACHATPIRNTHLAIDAQFDYRFMAKIALGIAYALFGNKVLQTAYAEKLYKALWHREGSDSTEFNGTSPLSYETPPRFLYLTGEENAVTITFKPSYEGFALNLNLGGSLNWTIKCASYENLETEEISRLGEGQVLVLYRQLQRAVVLSLPEYLAHKCGTRPNQTLTEISEMANLRREYLKNL